MIDLKILLTKILEHISKVGAYYANNVTTAALVANIDNYKTGAQLTLPAGKYIVYCYGSFSSSTSGAQLRGIRLYRVSPNEAGLWTWRENGPNGSWTTVSATLPLSLTAETKLRVDASSSTAVANGASTWIIAMRIK